MQKTMLFTYKKEYYTIILQLNLTKGIFLVTNANRVYTIVIRKIPIEKY